jgi:hypothetical protein
MSELIEKIIPIVTSLIAIIAGVFSTYFLKFKIDTRNASKEGKDPGNDRYKNTFPGRKREGVFRF